MGLKIPAIDAAPHFSVTLSSDMLATVGQMYALGAISTTAIVAWWGATLATLVFVWDIFKWRTSGARLKLDVKPNMMILGDAPVQPAEGSDTSNRWIIVRVANNGDRPTTLEKLFLAFYKSWWQRLRRKPEQSFYVKNPGMEKQFPWLLPSGETWDGLIKQTDETPGLFADGYLYCEVYHTARRRPARARIERIRTEPKSDED